MADAHKRFFTPTEVADLLMVSPVTVRQWAQKGLIDAHTTAGGHRRFPRSAVIAFARRTGIELNLPEVADADSARVLVVDDNRQFNGFLVALLTTRVEGVAVEPAYDGFEAGRKMQRFRPSIVLLDIMMPGIDGIEVCRAIKADSDTSAVRVIAMTGHYSPELERRIMAAGAERLLKKPFASNELLAACGFNDTSLETTDETT